MDSDLTWRALYDAHFKNVYRLVYSLGITAADVEDVTQRVFLVVNDKLQQSPDLVVDHPRAWLRAIAVRVISDYRRWGMVRRAKKWLIKSTAEATAPRRSPEEQTAAAEVQERVRQVLACMSPKLRDVLVLTDIEEGAPQEAAEALGIPLNTVRSRKRLAREQFIKLWHAQESGGRDGG